MIKSAPVKTFVSLLKNSSSGHLIPGGALSEIGGDHKRLVNAMVGKIVASNDFAGSRRGIFRIFSLPLPSVSAPDSSSGRPEPLRRSRNSLEPTRIAGEFVRPCSVCLPPAVGGPATGPSRRWFIGTATWAEVLNKFGPRSWLGPSRRARSCGAPGARAAEKTHEKRACTSTTFYRARANANNGRARKQTNPGNRYVIRMIVR